MNEKITATITAFKATVNAFDVESNNLVSVECNVSKQFAERDAIAYCESKNLLFCEILKTEESNSVKYEMDAAFFCAHATVMDKRPQGAYISRTVSVYTVTALVYSSVTHTATPITFKVDTENAGAIERKARQQAKALDTKLLKVLSVSEPVITLYVMPVADFCKWGKVVEE